MDELEVTEIDDDRISVPLMMLKGNMEILLSNQIPCEGVSLRYHGGAGVVLVFHGADRERAAELGFRLAKAPEDQ